MAPETEYYTPATLAKKWACSVDIVYDLLRSGKLHGFKLGKDWRIPDSARAAYEASGGQEPTRQLGRTGKGRIVMRVT